MKPLTSTDPGLVGPNRVLAQLELAQTVQLHPQIADGVFFSTTCTEDLPFVTEQDIERATADYMGMLATVMNALALQDAMRRVKVVSRVQSALNIEQVVEPYIRGKAMRYLDEGKVVIFAAGTGNPFFTTDTAAALRGMEMNVDLVLKATKVDGVYTDDPKTHPGATRYQRLTFDEAIVRNLKVMDATALTLCRDQKLPINVFSILKPAALRRVVLGENEGTFLHN